MTRQGLGRLAHLCILLAGVGAGIPAWAQMVIPRSLPVSGDRLFGQQCGACHSSVPGETRVGPSLAGVVGRGAGSLPGYAYSPALKASGITWTADTLDTWLSGTQQDVHGTKMIYTQADAAKRRAIIAYLDSISGR